jgi:16S rRNA processing protein RimM
MRVVFSGCNDRNCASDLIGCDIGIFRADLPDLTTDGFYWADIIGLEVINLQDELLGRVTGVLETGANDVLEVSGDKDYLIPFVQNVHIIEVSLVRSCIRVDWHIDD